jgi:hypothetical protein
MDYRFKALLIVLTVLFLSVWIGWATVYITAILRMSGLFS